MTEDFGGLSDQVLTFLTLISLTQKNFKLSSYFEKPFKLNNSKKNTIEYYET